MISSAQRVKVFKALGDGNRLHILHLLQRGEQCACVLLENLNLSQPTLSHHMKLLCDAGLVQSRKDGKWVYYTLQADTINEISVWLSELQHVSASVSGTNCRCQD